MIHVMKGSAVISVVVLQNDMDILKGEHSSCSDTCVTCTVDGNEVIGVETERASDKEEEEDQEPMTIPVIKTEPKVSGVPVVSVRHISFRLYPELPAGITGCLMKIK